MSAKLLAPRTAQWGATRVIAGTGPHYVVQVDVDAQNEYGALIRSNYAVALSVDRPKKGQWSHNNELSVQRCTPPLSCEQAAEFLQGLLRFPEPPAGRLARVLHPLTAMRDGYAATAEGGLASPLGYFAVYHHPERFVVTQAVLHIGADGERWLEQGPSAMPSAVRSSTSLPVERWVRTSTSGDTSEFTGERDGQHHTALLLFTRPLVYYVAVSEHRDRPVGAAETKRVATGILKENRWRIQAGAGESRTNPISAGQLAPPQPTTTPAFASPASFATATPLLATPAPPRTTVLQASDTIMRFYGLLSIKNTSAAYDLLTSTVQREYPRERFVAAYADLVRAEVVTITQPSGGQANPEVMICVRMTRTSGESLMGGSVKLVLEGSELRIGESSLRVRQTC